MPVRNKGKKLPSVGLKKSFTTDTVLRVAFSGSPSYVHFECRFLALSSSGQISEPGIIARSAVSTLLQLGILSSTVGCVFVIWRS